MKFIQIIQDKERITKIDNLGTKEVRIKQAHSTRLFL